MAASDTISAAAGPPKGRTKACTACRQVKLKCNAKDVYPAPCARCVAQDLECRMDSSFKRVPARKQLEEVTNRLMNLQRSLGLNEEFTAPSSSRPSPGGPVRHSQSETHGSHSERLLEHASQGLRTHSAAPSAADSDPASPHESKFLDSIDEPAEGQWTLGTVTLEYSQVLRLFRHFDKVLWRHAPFVEPLGSLHRLHKTSELLFWTMVLVSARLNSDGDSATIWSSLIQPHRALLFSTIFVTKQKLETIHAILLLCTWPYPVLSQFDDPTWLLCGVVIHMAISIGLHKPDHGHEYGLHNNDQIIGDWYCRNMTWMACFAINSG